MLTLQLTIENGQITARVNERRSHTFSLHDLNVDLKNFVNDPRPYGEKLFQALFKDGSESRKAFDELSKQSERGIVLVLESPELDGIAWEYAFNESKQEYVVEDCAFVRALPEKDRPANGRLTESVERVPLLFIPANPLVDLSGEPMRALNIEKEWEVIEAVIKDSDAPFDMRQLQPPTIEKLQWLMAKPQLIVHFSGHGGMKDGEAHLLFELENGASDFRSGREFISEIKDKAWIGFLSACQSAVPERTEFSNLARELAKAGVPFALGMQFNLPDPFAPNISGQFYNYLAHGHAVPEAARQARRAVKRENEFHEIMVGMIALYAAHPDELGKLTWRGSGTQTVSLFRHADVSDLPSPASGLIGRQRELMRIGTRLLEGTKPLTVTLHGAGGIGKTALLWQALLRFAPSFELTLAIGLDPLPSLESALGRVERFLGLPSPCANDTQEREALVRNALTSKRTLLGLDNFETLNYALNEKDSDKAKTAKSLHTFFKNLAANGVTLCVTSREVTKLGGEHVEEIQGLSNENGGILFQENVSEPKQKKQIYIPKTQQISEMVGGHPLALRLLASTFNDQDGISLDQFIEELQAFLPEASDEWTEVDRHESLRASFDFTMSNLVKTTEGRELQDALSRLSVFAAFFTDFTAAPVLDNKMFETEEEFEQMQPEVESILHSLWERGLLECTTLQLEDDNYSLYRLHPALGIFAKECLINAETVQKYFWESMNNLARIVDAQISKSTLLAQIASYALPDLLTAAKSKYDQDTALMQYRVGKLLKQFGLYDDALHLLEASRDTLEALNNHRDKTLALQEIARIYVARGNLDGAMMLHQQMFELMEELGDMKAKAVIIGEMAHIHVMRGNLGRGIEMNNEALAIFRALGEKREEAVSLVSQAQIYGMQANLERAMTLYQEGLETMEELGDLRGKSAILHSIAYILLMRGDLDGAMELYEKALDIVEGLGDLHAKASTVNNMGVVLFQGNYHLASLKMLLYALEIYVQLQAELDAQGTISLINQIMQKIGIDEFRNLWEEVTGSKQLPEWLNLTSN